LRESILSQQLSAASGVTQIRVQLEDSDAHLPQQLGVILDQKQLGAFDVALEQVDSRRIR
jgi:hypothetical protein